MSRSLACLRLFVPALDLCRRVVGIDWLTATLRSPQLESKASLLIRDRSRAALAPPVHAAIYPDCAPQTASRWSNERGYCVVMGQKVPIPRPRVHTTDDKEARLGSYEMFHRGEPLTETVWEKLTLGLSTRKYDRAVRQFTEAYGRS